MIPRIVKRGDLYALCYRYTDHANKKHIKLEPCASLDDAHLRLEEVMQQQEKGIFIPPNAITVSELMEDFIRVCGSRKWVASTYTANIGLYRNYILPVLGSCGIQNLHSKDVDIYIRRIFDDAATEHNGYTIIGFCSSRICIKPHSMYSKPSLLLRLPFLQHFKKALFSNARGRKCQPVSS